MSLLRTLVPGLPSDSAVKMANSAWVRMLIRPDYIAAVQTKFGAEALQLPSTDPKPINEWVKANTEGRIEKLFDGELDGLTVLVLVNTVFFKGSWAKHFDVKRTTKSEFKGFSSPAPCDMMFKEEKGTKYTETSSFQAVQLPYNDAKTWATILLPKKEGKEALAEVSMTLGETWDSLKKGFSTETVALSLPRFSLSAGGSITNPLRDLI